MSGICGVIRFDGRDVKDKDIKKILFHMHNNGNDREGICTKGNIGLGHKMLLVTPESLYETQPLVYKKGQITVVADARIDNREELIKQLCLSPNIDNVLTDIDIILGAYNTWGKACVEYLLGDFSFALWDSHKQELFCARDPMGIRPFYYYTHDNYFVFSSDIYSIMEGMEIKKKVDIPLLKNFMRTYALPYERTFYEKIFRLPPAHTLILNNRERKLERYWFPEKIEIDTQLSFEEAKEKFSTLFTQAIKARMRSAYPIGSHLSGGLDSSSVTAIAALECDHDLTAFSLRYGKLECDESEYSDALITQYNLNAEIVRGDLLDYETEYSISNYHEKESDWPREGCFMDEIAIMEKAKNLGIRVIMTGQGGDDILTGSDYVLTDYFKQMKFCKFFKALNYYDLSINTFKNFILLPLLPNKMKALLRKFLVHNKNEITTRYTSCYPDMEQAFEKGMSHTKRDDLQLLLGMGNAFYISSGLGISGRYNIEYNHPFYDKKLIEFTLSIPSHMKIENGITKKILRESMAEKLPECISERDDKAEFSEVLMSQLQAIDIDSINVQKIFELGIEKREKFELQLKSFKNGKLDLVNKLWDNLLIEYWLRRIYKV